MLPLTPDLMRACIAEEAALHSNIAELARLLTPPLSRVRRRQLRDGLAEAKASFARLYRLWCLRLPDPTLRALPPTHPDRRFFDRLQVRLAEAPAGFEALERLLRQGPQPLLPHPSPPDQPEAAQLTLQDRVWSRLHAGLAPVPLAAHIRENGQYDDIAYPVADFLRLLQLARRVAVALGKTKVRFLDVGCGTGLKVLMAAKMFGQAEGLEYQPDLASAAATLLRATEARIHTGDALRFDGYDAFDIIYFYKPIHLHDDLAAMEARIVAQARAGTILIAPYAGFAYRAEALGCSAIEGFVHIKGVSGKELERLKQRVAWVGFGDPRPPSEPPQGFAAPLLAVLRAWGQLP